MQRLLTEKQDALRIVAALRADHTLSEPLYRMALRSRDELGEPIAELLQRSEMTQSESSRVLVPSANEMLLGNSRANLGERTHLTTMIDPKISGGVSKQFA